MLIRVICLGLIIIFTSCNIAIAKDSKEVKTYLKTQKKISKLNKRKEQQTKEINFLKHRLKIQEQKLEVFTSEDNSTKGEEE